MILFFVIAGRCGNDKKKTIKKNDTSSSFILFFIVSFNRFVIVSSSFGPGSEYTFFIIFLSFFYRRCWCYRFSLAAVLARASEESRTFLLKESRPFPSRL